MASEASNMGAMTTTSRRAITFDPDRLAYLEAKGWRENYDRKWLNMLGLVVQLAHEQFELSWPRAVQAAYYITRASVAWVPIDHDLRVVRRYIRKFYRVAARYGKGMDFDAKKVADIELKYWIAHRELSGRPDNEKGPLIRSLAELHSATFNLPLDAVWQSGVDRARAADTVDLITSKRSNDIEADWVKVEDYLRKAYSSIADLL